MRRKFKENENFKNIAAWIDENDDRLRNISFKAKRDYVGFFQEVALMMNSGLVKRGTALYMFGYFAARCYDSEKFWERGIKKESIYWKLFRNFALQTKEKESPVGYDEKDFRI